jgi:hypothetical protein
MLHVHDPCLCCMSMHHVRSSCPFCMYTLHVHAACPCCMSMLHVPAACPRNMFMPHVHNQFPYCMSRLHVYAVCPCCMVNVHVNAACPSSMSMLLLHAECLWHARTTCRCCFSWLHAYVNVHATYKYRIPVLSVLAAHTCCMSVLHVACYFSAVCPCCSLMLPVYAASPFWTSILLTVLFIGLFSDALANTVLSQC